MRGAVPTSTSESPFKAFGYGSRLSSRAGEHGWLEKVVGGWSISGIFNIHSGFGWTPNFGTGQSLYCSNCGYYNLRPSYLGGAGKSTSNKAFETGSNYPNYAAIATAANAAATAGAHLSIIPDAFPRALAIQVA